MSFLHLLQIPPIEGVPQYGCAAMSVAPALFRAFVMSTKILQHYRNNVSIDRFNSYMQRSSVHRRRPQFEAMAL